MCLFAFLLVAQERWQMVRKSPMFPGWYGVSCLPFQPTCHIGLCFSFLLNCLDDLLLLGNPGRNRTINWAFLKLQPQVETLWGCCIYSHNGLWRGLWAEMLRRHTLTRSPQVVVHLGKEKMGAENFRAGATLEEQDMLSKPGREHVYLLCTHGAGAGDLGREPMHRCGRSGFNP